MTNRRIEYISIDEIQQADLNPKRHADDLIDESYARFGYTEPSLLDERTGKLVAGHGRLNRLLALRAAGKQPPEGVSEDWKMPVVMGWSSKDDEEAQAYLLASNRLTELGGWDNTDLLRSLEQLENFSGTGFDAAYLEQLNAELTKNDQAKTDKDYVPKPPANPITKPGDMWRLGPHLLVCGDSTDVGVISKVLEGRKADLVWTDPPYGVAYVGKTKDSLTIKNDKLDEKKLYDFLAACFGGILTYTKPGACWYVAAPAGPIGLVFGNVLHKMGIFRQRLIWVKDRFVLGHSDYHYRHEDVYYGETPALGESDPAHHEVSLPAGPEPEADKFEEMHEDIYYGWSPGAAHQPPPDRKQDTVWEIPRPKASREHPTMKPVDLITKAIENSCNPGAVVLDTFGGSGSTLIACHHTNRKARLIELDPVYADVICRRYQEHTGTKPVRSDTNEPYDFIEGLNA